VAAPLRSIASIQNFIDSVLTQFWRKKH